VDSVGPAATILSPSPKATDDAQASRGGERGLPGATAGPVLLGIAARDVTAAGLLVTTR
jgi:hypothetical protein